MHVKRRLSFPSDGPMRWTMMGVVIVTVATLYLLAEVWVVLHGSVKIESDLRNLPTTAITARSQPPGDAIEAIIHVYAYGRFTLDGSEPLPNLAAALKGTAARRSHSDVQIIIQADEKASPQSVTKILDQLQGYNHVTLMVNEGN